MDAHTSYNQVPLRKEDEEKTVFTSKFGTFCFKVMPFGLQNTGTTFQRLMNKVFANQLGQNIKIYVDDILVKSKKKENHLRDLAKTFQNLT